MRKVSRLWEASQKVRGGPGSIKIKKRWGRPRVSYSPEETKVQGRCWGVSIGIASSGSPNITENAERGNRGTSLGKPEGVAAVTDYITEVKSERQAVKATVLSPKDRKRSLGESTVSDLRPNMTFMWARFVRHITFFELHFQ